ncbi:MAG: DUF4276 family protein [Caldilineaceae bacterium]|nr:DUF4276 family protein [Caldilineaceae bacterium]
MITSWVVDARCLLFGGEFNGGVLGGLLGRLFPKLVFQCVTYDGWSDLERSVPVTLRSWHVPGDRFVIVRDSDGRDCHAIKQRIVDSCKEIGRDDVLVRIVCQELEDWYLGDFVALAEAYDSPRVLRHQAKDRFRNPDSVRNPSDAVATLVGPFRKMEAARRLGNLVEVERNRSQSFRVVC